LGLPPAGAQGWQRLQAPDGTPAQDSIACQKPPAYLGFLSAAGDGKAASMYRLHDLRGSRALPSSQEGLRLATLPWLPISIPGCFKTDAIHRVMGACIERLESRPRLRRNFTAAPG